ncbi:MAG: thrombospondin type 3 repeat:Cna B-type [Gammaproteobacteria bacterium]|jgi:hypothetical protein|nr:thrombospondin type 3 repeat:Cna B-type [Gammaproteobacteria bacterium]
MKNIIKTSLAVALIDTSASAAVIDFEGFASGRIIDDEYAPAVTISARNFSAGPDFAVIFDTDNPTGGDNDLGAPFNSLNAGLTQDYRPGNVLIIQERNNCKLTAGFCTVADDEGSRPAGQIRFTFASPVILQSLDFFDIETDETNPKKSAVQLFDINDKEILAGTFSVPSTGGDNLWSQLVFGNVEGVKRLKITMAGSGAIDNLTYVPVPAAVWLFGSALIGLWGLRRRAARAA